MNIINLENNKGEKWIKHYSSSHQILLVGEGDFSFAASLAKAFGSASNMVATSLDSRETLIIKYTSATRNVRKLEELGCTVIHGVDAGTMSQHALLNHNSFDRIVFNFPHAGFHGREDNPHLIELHKEVVRGYLKSASELVKVGGEVHITHKTGHPYSKWEVEKIGDEVGLMLVAQVPFSIYDYPRYQNKRGDGYRSDYSFPVGRCSTFKFQLCT